MRRKRPQVLGGDLNRSEIQSGRPQPPPVWIMCLVLRPQRLGGDDAYAVERAADSLHCAGVNSKTFGNDADTRSPRSRQSLTDSFLECGGDWGTPKAFTLTPGPREASTDSFLNHRPLELGKHAHHLKHRLAGRRGRI